MKNTMKYLSMAVVALMGAVMAACSADDSIVSEPQQSQGRAVTLTTTVNMGSGSTTRALTSKGVKTFAVGEQMTIWYETNTPLEGADDNWRVTMTEPLKASDISADGKSATITVTMIDPMAKGFTMWFYPAPMGGPQFESIKDFNNYWSPLQACIAGQDGTLEYVAANVDWAYFEGDMTDDAELPSSITLENPFAVFAFSLLNEDGSEDLTSTVKNLTVKKNDTYFSINRKQPYGDTIYFAMPAYGNINMEYTAITVDNKVYTKTVTNKTYESGHFYALGLQMTPSSAVTDLSLVDCAGKARTDGRWTANCYMVHHIGQYKLPLVYGNAIKAGQTNAAAYTGIESDNTTLTFPNHTGQPITAPWIKDNGITVASAELLWQDTQGLITTVGIDGDYLTLTVGTDAVGQEGNAVVAAKDADGNIVWSWHIWVTGYEFNTYSLTTIDTGDHTYKVTPANLGWVGHATSPTGYNTYYQWGRKDAFIPGSGADNNDRTVYNINNEPVTGLTYSTTDATFANNIKNPTTFYISDNIPYETGYYNLWDAKLTTPSDNISTATVKTVYDPCPAGFCVPTGNLYNYIQQNSQNNFAWNDIKKGRLWKVGYSESYFPASGYRKSNDGTLNHVGVIGCYWAATPVFTSGWSLVLGSNNALWTTYYRDFGFSVRAVAEQ